MIVVCVCVCVPGALMLLAWMGSGSVGTVVARYLKVTDGRSCCGKDRWFVVRRKHLFVFLHICQCGNLIVISVFVVVCFNRWTYDLNVTNFILRPGARGHDECDGSSHSRGLHPVLLIRQSLVWGQCHSEPLTPDELKQPCVHMWPSVFLIVLVAFIIVPILGIDWPNLTYFCTLIKMNLR